MKSIQLTKLGLGGLAWALAVTASSENWPTWRGPAANGMAPGGNPPTEFSESKNVQWKIKLPGSGNSTPVIWGDQVFVLTAEKTGKKVAAAAGGESRERGQRPGSERPEGRERGSRGGDRPRPDGDRGSRDGERPRPMENAADAVVSAAVNGAADPASVAAHSIVRSLSSVLTRTATVS